jgi:hypothetical protein
MLAFETIRVRSSASWQVWCFSFYATSTVIIQQLEIKQIAAIKEPTELMIASEVIASDGFVHLRSPHW